MQWDWLFIEGIPSTYKLRGFLARKNDSKGNWAENKVWNGVKYEREIQE